MANNNTPEEDIANTCRLCQKCLLVKGVITNSRTLFCSKEKGKPLSERFKDLGVVLPCRPGVFSARICKPCFNILVRAEESISIINRWKCDAVVDVETADGGGTGREKRERETPTKRTPRKKKLCRRLPPNPDARVSTTEVYINYPSKIYPEKYTCDSDISGVINNLAKRNFPRAANLMVHHAGLMDALKPVMVGVIDQECKSLCHQRNGFVLWKSSPEELKKFSLHSLKEDLEQKAPFMFSVICTISGMQTNHACAAAAIALRGRDSHLSAFAYYVNSVLQYGGAKKAVFERLSKFGITTVHSNAVLKQQAMSALCGEDLKKLKATRERPPTAQESIEEPVTVSFQSHSEYKDFQSLQSWEDTDFSDLGLAFLAIDDDDFTPSLPLSPPQPTPLPGTVPTPTLLSPPHPTPAAACIEGTVPTTTFLSPLHPTPPAACIEGTVPTPTLLSSPHPTPAVFEEASSSLPDSIPPSYSVIFDNLDFFSRVHHQSTSNQNKSIHWTHHVVVEDRVALDHLSDEKPLANLENYDLANSLPDEDTQKIMRRDFIVLASRVVCKHLAAFKPFSSVVVKHIPHEYSDQMSKPSTSHPMGLILKNENVNTELVEILRHIQKEYVPSTDEGCTPILVGGDRLTEANSRNVQWAFANGPSEKDRLEDLLFMFLDWHAVRNLYEIYHSLFFKEGSARDHGTLCANLNIMKSSNAKAGPHKAFNPYKEAVKKDTSALILAATMEHLGLKTTEDVPDGLIPDGVLEGTEEEKRSWLNHTIGEVIDTFAFFKDLDEADSMCEPPDKNKFPCRAPGCTKLYIFAKTRSRHELSKHGITYDDCSMTEPRVPTPSDSESDLVKEHSEARLRFGLFLADMQDAIKEGDGGRLMHLYRMALLFYKVYGHTQYAYSTLLLTVQLKATLSPRMAHSVTWNRFYNGKGGRGRNIPLDLSLEHLNNFLKSFLKGVGPNLSENTALRISKSLSVLKDLIENVDEEIGITGPSGYHKNSREDEDILAVVEISMETGLFKNCPGREHTAFKGFRKHLFSQLNYSELRKWMLTKLEEFSMLYI